MGTKNKRVPTSSVSQVENYRGCKRKWFLSSIEYLPQEPRRSTAIGDCLHLVLERYLDVDEQGLNKEGKAPDLYPEGWHIQKDYFGNKVLFVLDKSEQQIIKNLVKKGIDEGKVIRRPDAKVEYVEKIFITPEITFQVRIDYAYDWTIEDHKTCKNFRYTLSPDENHVNYLGKDTQLKVYAYFWALRQSEFFGVKIPEKLTIRHNQFCVDPKVLNSVRTPETEITFKECEEAYLELKKVVLEQLEWRKKKDAGEIKFWDMEKDLDTCGNYGGCPYKQVCTAQEAPAFYKSRIKAKVDELTEKLKIEKEDPMPAFNINNTGGTKAQEEVLGQIEGAETTKIAPEPELDTLKTLKKAYAELDKTCKDMGMAGAEASPKGKELIEAIDKLQAIEDKAKAKKAKDAKAKKEAEKAEEEAAAKKVSDEKVAAEKAAIASKAVKPEAPTGEAESESEEKPEEIILEPLEQQEMDYEMKPAVSGRSKEVTICIGCSPVSGKQTKTISLYAVFAAQACQIAAASEKSSYFDLDPYKRREQFYRAAPTILSELEGITIIVPAHLGPDENALLSALLLDKNVRAYSA